MEKRVVTKEFRAENNGDCGIVSLMIIGDYFGCDSAFLSGYTSAGIEGTDAESLKKLALKMRLKLRGWKSSFVDLYEHSFPQIILINLNHYVVLEGFDGDKVYINDPMHGRKVCDVQSIKKEYSAVTFTVEPAEEGNCAKACGYADADDMPAEEDKNSAEDNKCGNVIYAFENGDRRADCRRGGIYAENIVYHYGRRKFFDGLGFEIKSGETVAFVGSMAAGKTTLLRILAGKEKFTSGELLLGSVKEKTAYVEEKPVFPEESLEKILGAGGEQGEKIAQALYDVDLLNMVTEAGRGLSLIYSDLLFDKDAAKQLAIARELIKEPEILIIDTMPENIGADRLCRILKRLKLRGCTLVIGSQVKEAVKTADRLFVLSRGRLVQIIEKSRNVKEEPLIKMGKRDSFLCKDGTASSLIESGKVFIFSPAEKEKMPEPLFVANAGDIIPDGVLMKAIRNTALRRIPEGRTPALEEYFAVQCRKWQSERSLAFSDCYEELKSAEAAAKKEKERDMPAADAGKKDADSNGDYTDISGGSEQDSVDRAEELAAKIRRKIEKGEIFVGTIYENMFLNSENISEEMIKSVLKEYGLLRLVNRLPMGLNTILNEDGEGMSEGERKAILEVRKKYEGLKDN